MNKRKFVIGLLAFSLLSLYAFAQQTIVEYEYWFNDDYNGRINTGVSPENSLTLIIDVPVAGLANGMHLLNFRAKDSQGKYSSTVSRLFYKTGITDGDENSIVAWEYWFDDNYQDKTEGLVTSTGQTHIVTQIDVSSLSDGMHILNFRAQDSQGMYGSTVSQLFNKTGITGGDENSIVAWEYWYDDNFQEKIKVNVTTLSQTHIITQIDVNSLSNGMHMINFRTLDAKGFYSSTIQQMFFKKPLQSHSDAEIIAYKYWFDNDHENLVYNQLDNTAGSFDLIDMVDMTQIPKGLHTIHYQFEDNAGYWSVVTTDTIEKISLPVADFTYTVISENCDSTIAEFENLSIDGDIFLWDFGDGSTDDSENPTHTFLNPGIWPVNLTITDTLTFAESTYYASISVIGNTFSSAEITACDSYTSPSGNYTWFESGIYTDTIPNHWGCDSIITMDVTINFSSEGTDVITACDSFTWIDGVTYTASNNTATYILANTTGCDSVVSLDLTINYTPDNSVIQEGITLTAVATDVNYQWLDCNDNLMPLPGETNQSFTATVNGDYAVELSDNGCVVVSDCYSVTSVGILENNFGSGFTLYPNPTGGNLTIDLGKVYKRINVSLINMNGNITSEKTFETQQIVKMNITAPSGVYFIVIRADQKKALLKVIRE